MTAKRAQIKTTLNRILVEHNKDLQDRAIEESDRFDEDLDMDSLDHLELITSVEEEFGVEIADPIAAEFKTVGQLLDYLEKWALI